MLRVLLVLLFLGLPITAMAEDDHDRALLLRHQGEIMPLAEILQRVSGKYPGQPLEVELKERKPHLAYEIRMLSEDGVVREITVDAVTGDILAAEED